MILLLRAILIVASIFASAPAFAQLPAGVNSARSYVSGVYVAEITMAAPDIICIELHDPDPTPLAIEILSTPLVGSRGTWQQVVRPSTGRTELALPIGIASTKAAFSSHPSRSYLNRQIAKDATKWAAIGGRTVTQVLYEDEPFLTPQGYAKTTDTNIYGNASVRHYVWLKLASSLTNGSYTIAFPPDLGVANTTFAYNDKTTRAQAIKMSFVGYRPSDPYKVGHMTEWVPGLSNNGNVDLFGSYGLTTFQMIDATGTLVKVAGSTAPITMTLRLASTGNENFSLTAPNPSGNAKQWAYGDVAQSWRIQSISKASPGVLTTTTPNTLANGDIIVFGPASSTGSFLAPPSNASTTAIYAAYAKVENVDPTTNSFQLFRLDGTTPIDMTGFTFIPGVDLGAASDMVFKTYTVNAAGADNYSMTFSSLTASDLVGTTPPYRLYIAGLGVSDSFRLDDNVYRDFAGQLANGQLVQSVTLPLSIAGPPAYSKPIGMLDGFNGRTIYESNLPVFWTTQGGAPFQPIQCEAIANKSWQTSTEATGFGFWYADAADWDEYSNHAFQTTNALIAYDFLSPTRANVNWGVPKNGQIIRPDNGQPLFGSAYTESDGLGDIIQLAEYDMHGYRITQKSSWGPAGLHGAVYAGAEGRAQTDWNRASSYGYNPSWESTAQWNASLPDHRYTFAYASGAAALGTALYLSGAPNLGDAYMQSAFDAWDWADDVYQHMVPNTVTMTGVTGRWYPDSTITFSNGTTAKVTYGGNALTTIAIYNLSGPLTTGVSVTNPLGGGATNVTAVSLNNFGGATNGGGFNPFYYYSSQTGVQSRVSFTANTVNGSNVLTNVSNFTGLKVGMGIDVILFNITVTSGSFTPGESFGDTGGVMLGTVISQSGSTMQVAGLSALPGAAASLVGFSSGATATYNSVSYSPLSSASGASIAAMDQLGGTITMINWTAQNETFDGTVVTSSPVNASANTTATTFIASNYAAATSHGNGTGWGDAVYNLNTNGASGINTFAAAPRIGAAGQVARAKALLGQNASTWLSAFSAGWNVLNGQSDDAAGWWAYANIPLVITVTGVTGSFSFKQVAAGSSSGTHAVVQRYDAANSLLYVAWPRGSGFASGDTITTATGSATFVSSTTQADTSIQSSIHGRFSTAGSVGADALVTVFQSSQSFPILGAPAIFGGMAALNVHIPWYFQGAYVNKIGTPATQANYVAATIAHIGVWEGDNPRGEAWTVGVGPNNRFIHGVQHQDALASGAMLGPPGVSSWGSTWTPVTSGNGLGSFSGALQSSIENFYTLNSSQWNLDKYTFEPPGPLRPAWASPPDNPAQPSTFVEFGSGMSMNLWMLSMFLDGYDTSPYVN